MAYRKNPKPAETAAYRPYVSQQHRKVRSFRYRQVISALVDGGLPVSTLV
jgi:hypothetical protein